MDKAGSLYCQKNHNIVHGFSLTPCVSQFSQSEEVSQANIRVGLLEKRLDNSSKEVWALYVEYASSSYMHR